MVDAILRAAARVLVKEGYENANTNRIAHVAGVSVGSLYQYFPNKESLMRALLDEHVKKIQAVLTPDPALLTQPLEVAAKTLVEAMLAVHAVDPALHAQLLKAGHALGQSPNEVLHQTGESLVRLMMTVYKTELCELDAELSPFIISSAVEAVVREACDRYPRRLTDPRFVDELTKLVVRYVKRESNCPLSNAVTS